MNYRLLTILIIIASVWPTAGSQTLNDTVTIHFRQSKTNLDPGYMDNEAALKHIEQSITRDYESDSDTGLLNVKVIGGASPEGSVKFNRWLSEERARRIYDYLKNHIAMPDSLTTVTLLGRDWNGLLKMVEEDRNVPAREEVIATLRDIIAANRNGEKESYGNLQRLKRVDGGKPYLYMYRTLFPSLRESGIELTFGRKKRPLPINFITELPREYYIVTETFEPGMIPVSGPERKKPFYMALKTNMLLDLLAVPEVSAEFYLGKNFSIVGNWMYGWWDNDREHRYWRMYGGDVALRWWFGKAAHSKPLTGHHIGIYGGVVTYDFEFGGKGYMGGLPGRPLWDRCNVYGGIEYGYSLPIARRLNLDFTLGLGYLGGRYIEYVPNGRCYEWQATKHKHWYGPTKLEVSLTWLIGRGNVNLKKGGRL